MCRALVIVLLVFVGAVRAAPGAAPAIDWSRATVHVSPQPVRLPVVDASDLRFVRLSPAQGMVATRVRHIIQDDEGFIWFGSDFGLDRYDGYKFKFFTHDPHRSDSLGGTHVDSLFKDRSGFLWIGTDQALDRLDTRTQTFTHYRLQTPDHRVIHTDIVHINQDHDGSIWLATGSGLLRLNPSTGTMRLFEHAAGDSDSLTSNDVKSTFEDKEHRFWVPNSAGLDEFDRRTGKVIRRLPLEGPVREFLVHEDRAGSLWLAYASGRGAGLDTLNPDTNELRHYAFTGEDASGLAYSGVYAIAEDHDGNLWFGTGGMGLLRLDAAGGRFLRYRNHLEDPQSLAENHTTSLLVDRAGNLWAGLNATGPNISDLRPPLFRHVIHNLGSHGGGEMLVYCIFQDRRGDLWIGAASGLFRLDPDSGAATFVRTDERNVSAGVVSIVEDPSGDLWLGTVGQGLKRFDPRTGRVVRSYTHLDSDPDSLSDDLIEGLRFDGRGRLWASTWNGFEEFDVAGEHFTVHKPDPLRRTEPYNKFVQDKDGSYWIGSESGLTHFDPRTSRFTRFAHSDEPGTISSNHVGAVFMDSRGQVWVGTLNGLDRLNADGSFSVYGPGEGLAANAVGCILEDDAGDLWLSTNKGISRFSPGSRTFTNYSAADGVGDLLGWSACLKRPDGEMLFGGYTGLIAFNPTKVVDIASHAPIRLSDFRINGQTVQLDPSSPLQKTIAAASQITLSHEQRSFSLEFASLNFLSSSATRYRYKMEGLDSQWIEVGSDQRVVSYTSLPSGTYVFRAQAAVGRGSWSEPGVALRIHVLPPWWRTWWFITMLSALLLLLGWSALSYRLRSIARQYEVRLEERVRERTRIARELHDTLLQGFQGLMLQLQAVAERVKTEPEQGHRLIEQTLERADTVLGEGRDRVWNLRSADRNPVDLSQVFVCVAGESTPNAAKVHVAVEGAARELQPVVREEIERIGTEAIMNALRHAKAATIEVDLIFERRQFTLRVSDDGIGIDPAVAHAGREGHFGLTGMRERARNIRGSFLMASRSGGGTEIELIVPAAVAYVSGRVGTARLWLRRAAIRDS